MTADNCNNNKVNHRLDQKQITSSKISEMGSYRKAVMTGFICRLCSESKSVVVHVYSKRGRSLNLLEKIKALPISVKVYDNLPKTICEKCIENLNLQWKLMKDLEQTETRLLARRMERPRTRLIPVTPIIEQVTVSYDELVDEQESPEQSSNLSEPAGRSESNGSWLPSMQIETSNSSTVIISPDPNSTPGDT